MVIAAPSEPALLADAVEQVIRKRRTVRRLDGRKVGRVAVERLLELACLAPSPHNVQPWRFAVVLDREVRERLASEMGEAWRIDLERDGQPRRVIKAKLKDSSRRLVSAALIVVCLDRRGLEPYSDEVRRSAELTMGIQSIGAAIQNLLLAAHSLGLGANWMCAPLFCPEIVRSCLGLDAGWEPQAFILLGTPACRPPVPPRKSLGQVATFIGG